MLHYGNQQQIKRWHPAPSRTRLHSLWAQLDFTQTCLAGKRICLTGGLTEPIFRTATARSEPAAQLAAGGKNLKEQEGEHRRTSEVSLARTADGWLQRPGYEHDRQLRQQSLNSAPIFFFFFYQDFMVHLRVFLFIYFFFLQHQEYDLAVHLHADMVTLAGLLWMLIYMGCAFSWAPDDIPHGSRWY